MCGVVLDKARKSVFFFAFGSFISSTSATVFNFNMNLFFLFGVFGLCVLVLCLMGMCLFFLFFFLFWVSMYVCSSRVKSATTSYSFLLSSRGRV